MVDAKGLGAGRDEQGSGTMVFNLGCGCWDRFPYEVVRVDIYLPLFVHQTLGIFLSLLNCRGVFSHSMCCYSSVPEKTPVPRMSSACPPEGVGKYRSKYTSSLTRTAVVVIDGP